MHGSVRKGYGGSPKPDAEWNVRADAEGVPEGLHRRVAHDDHAAGHLRHRPSPRREIRQGGQVQRPDRPGGDRELPIWWKAGNPGKPEKIDASSTLFDTVAAYLSFSRDLLNIERLPIRVTDDGFTRIDPKAKEIDCAMSWKDLGAFEDLLVERLTGGR